MSSLYTLKFNFGAFNTFIIFVGAETTNHYKSVFLIVSGIWVTDCFQFQWYWRLHFLFQYGFRINYISYDKNKKTIHCTRKTLNLAQNLNKTENFRWQNAFQRQHLNVNVSFWFWFYFHQKVKTQVLRNQNFVLRN